VTPAPDYAEPILGWRAWHVVETSEGLRLHSIARPVVWAPGEEMSAGCLRHRSLLRPWRKPAPHPAPQPECSCGVYAVRSARTALRGLDVYSRPWRPLHRVIGQVSLWGTVIEGELGWRATTAYPHRLYVPSRRLHGPPVLDLDRIIAALGDYGVPVEPLDGGARPELARELARHGAPRAA
jgi:hypothetical protein